MAFYIGDRVVCVDDTISIEIGKAIRRLMPNWVVKDQEYTIRGFQENDGIVLGILLEEITNPPVYIPIMGRIQEPAFTKSRFRKLKSNEVLAEAVTEVFEMA